MPESTKRWRRSSAQHDRRALSQTSSGGVFFSSRRVATTAPSGISQHTQNSDLQQSPTPNLRAADDLNGERDDLVVVAVDIRDRGTVGCSYYVAREERLFCMEDVRGGSDSLVQSLIAEIRPTVVLMSHRVDPSPRASDPARLARLGSLVDDDEEMRLPYQLEFRPASEFGIESAKTKLVNLDSLFEGRGFDVRFVVPGDLAAFETNSRDDDIGLTGRQGRVLRLSAWIDLDNTMSLGCVGTVVSFLQRRRAAEFLQDDADAQWAYRIQNIEMFTLAATMFINADTLLSLQIIQPESHPNAYNQGPGTSGSKESLSVYGLFHHFARTPQGKARLRQYFLRPSIDLHTINARLDFVTVFTRPDNDNPMAKMSKLFSKIKNLRPVMVQLHKGISTGNNKFGGFKSGVWATLLDFAFYTIDVRETLGEVSGAEMLPIVSEAMHVLDADQLRRIGTMIHEVVDIDLCVEQHRTIVKDGIDETLDGMKRRYDGLDDLLGHVARNIQATLPPTLGLQVDVVYFPQLGFHITLPLDPTTGDTVYDGGHMPWERMFTTQTQIFFKDQRMREMDSQIGDIWSMICALEIEISYDLAQRVLMHEKMLVSASDACGELDSLLALAIGATHYRLVRPRMTDDNVIEISQGRHLLQEMTVPSYVPNDTLLVGGKGTGRLPQNSSHRAMTTHPPTSPVVDEQRERPSMIMLTGPNYSGKSVYQKQVALAVYMAHIGSFVAAEGAIIGLTDKILTRITTRETVSKTQSAFMIDLQQTALTLNLATRRSLVIIDEFGKGTDSSDGAGLATGVFHHLLSLGDDSPKAIVATHFHEIFEHGFLGPHPRLAMYHMEVHVDKQAKSLDDQVTYLYNLRPGPSTESFGTNCAALNGIATPIIKRANLLAKLSRKGYDLVSVCAGVSRDEEEELEHAERVTRRFLSEDLGTWEHGSVLGKLKDVLGEQEEESGGGDGGREGKSPRATGEDRSTSVKDT